MGELLRDANRQLVSYRHGRILFAGDAAHRQMPIGGQALNLGLQDAFDLGWKLAATVSGRAGDGLLDTYHQERHAVGRRVLANIEAQARLLLGGSEVEPVRTVLAELIAYAPVREHLAGMISGLDIRYEAGPADQPLLGARLPHTVLLSGQGHLTTSQLLHPARGILVDLSGGAGAPLSPYSGWCDRVSLLAALPRAGSALDGTGCVLVRPDGHVAWAGDGTAGLRQALERWFGPPR